MPNTSSPFDLAQAHRYFAANCFNDTWSQIEKPDRTPAEDDAMVLTAAASLWHWMQRHDCTDENLSIGHWLLSRTLALAEQGEASMRHGLRALELAAESSGFYVGYGHEAVARAAVVLNDEATFHTHLQKAQRCLGEVADPSEREMLEQDLQNLTSPASNSSDGASGP